MPVSVVVTDTVEVTVAVSVEVDVAVNVLHKSTSCQLLVAVSGGVKLL